MHNERCHLIGLAATVMAAWCQTPVVSKVANAASYQATLGPAGTIVTIFGTSLAGTTSSARGFPLPLELSGTSVTVGGVAAPLFYVSPTQINLQAPSGGAVVVSTAAGTSAPYLPGTATPSAWYAGGIFTTDASGCGQGAVLNVSASGSVSVNSPANSASPGDYISIYGTGIAEVYSSATDSFLGMPIPSSPLFTTIGYVGVVFDFANLNNATPAAWSGLAPGFAGLDQSNVKVPATAREGCAVPIQAAYYDNSPGISQPVTIAIRNGGGPCVDPPSAGYGQITWQKTVSTVEPQAVSESDTISVSLQASPGKQVPPAPAYSDCPSLDKVCDALPGSRTLFGSSCSVPGYRSLGAGTVTAQGPNLSPAQVPSLPFQSGQLAGLSAYQTTLVGGTIQAGKYVVTASGGADVGAFQAAIQIGQDIQIQTALAGLMFSSCKSLAINWTGGDPNSWVTARIVQHVPSSAGGSQFVNSASQTRTSNGTLTLQPIPSNACMIGPTPVVISIEVDPDPSEVNGFSASGLSLGGQATWKYIHTFQAIWGTN